MGPRYDPVVVLTSRLNSTPPIGEPNATEIPAAAAAERTSRLRADTLWSRAALYMMLGLTHLRCHSGLEIVSLRDLRSNKLHGLEVLLFQAITLKLLRGTSANVRLQESYQ